MSEPELDGSEAPRDSAADPGRASTATEGRSETERESATESESATERESDATPGALAVVCGLPGVGKTTVARRVATHLDGEILRTDVIRKELFEDPAYTDAETERVYAELIERARERVEDGRAVVLDATFADAGFRADVREMGERAAGSFDLVEVECDEAVVERRIERRDGVSDADFEIHLLFKEAFDGIRTDHVVVDNSGGEAETLARVDAVFGDGERRDGATSDATGADPAERR